MGRIRGEGELRTLTSERPRRRYSMASVAVGFLERSEYKGEIEVVTQLLLDSPFGETIPFEVQLLIITAHQGFFAKRLFTRWRKIATPEPEDGSIAIVRGEDREGFA